MSGEYMAYVWVMGIPRGAGKLWRGQGKDWMNAAGRGRNSKRTTSCRPYHATIQPIYPIGQEV